MTDPIPGPEQRVRDYLDVATADGLDTADTYGDHELAMSDLRDVLAELAEHRRLLIEIDEALDTKEPSAQLAAIRRLMGRTE